MGSHKALIALWQDATGRRNETPTNDELARFISDREALPSRLAAVAEQSRHDWADHRPRDQWDDDQRVQP